MGLLARGPGDRLRVVRGPGAGQVIGLGLERAVHGVVGEEEEGRFVAVVGAPGH